MMRLEIKNGMTLDLGSSPSRLIDVEPAAVALMGADYPGVRPQLAVAAGDLVEQGDVLFVDRARPALCFTAPAAGRISAVHLGARRHVDAVVIEADPGRAAPILLSREARSADDVRQALLASGLWPALRCRPYDRIPGPEERAAELYVTAIDTQPLAPDPAPIIQARADEFREGIARLSMLVETCYVCMASGADLPCPESAGVVPVSVSGPHPAGLPGTHIYGVAALRNAGPPSAEVWHVGYQDVIAIGALFLGGRLDARRTVAVCGPELRDGRLVRTRYGAVLGDLIGALPDNMMVISGSVLSGREAGRMTGFLGRYHQQVVVLPAAAEGAAVADGSGMLALECFERVWPLGIPVLPVLKAVLVEDSETLASLGATHLAPEDLSLCAYLCPSRLDFGAALERTLDALRRGD